MDVWCVRRLREQVGRGCRVKRAKAPILSLPFVLKRARIPAPPSGDFWVADFWQAAFWVPGFWVEAP